MPTREQLEGYTYCKIKAREHASGKIIITRKPKANVKGVFAAEREQQLAHSRCRAAVSRSHQSPLRESRFSCGGK